MSIVDRIQAINDHLIDDYKVLRLAGADLTGVNKNIVNLKMSWKERLLYFMNNGTDEVWNNWDKVNGTGTTLSLNNTEEAPMSLTYKGNTSQNGTPTPTSPIPVQVVSGDNSIVVCGKNLVNINDNYIKRENATYSNITVSNNTLSFEITGSRSGYVGYIIPTTIGQTYTLSFNLAKGFIYTIELDNVISDISGNFGLERTTPYTYTATKQYIGVWLSGGNTTDNQASVSNLMLEHGSPASTYEEYKGASYPISLSSKNLFDFRTVQNGDIKNSNSAIRLCSRQNIWLEAGTYTFSTNMPSNYSYGLTTQTVGVPPLASYPTYVYDSGWKTTSSTTFTLASAGYFVVQYKEANNGNISPMDLVNYHFQLEKGSTATDYVPYNPNPIELCKIGTYQDKIDKSSGKNLFDYNSFEAFTTSLKYVTLNLKPNTQYTLSSNIPASTADISTNLFILNSTDSPNSTINGVNPTTPRTATTNADGVIKIGYRDIQNILTNEATTYWYMLNEGSTALPYEPYGTGWYLKKEIGKVVLNGSENWEGNWNSTNNTNGFVFRNFPSASAFVSTDSGCRYYSNHFNFSSSTAYYQDKELLYINSSNASGMKVSKTTAPDLATFKTWLGNNNVSVYYVLATPTYEYITDTTLLSQLEALKKSYESVTNISQVNNDLPFELNITALSNE